MAFPVWYLRAMGLGVFGNEQPPGAFDETFAFCEEGGIASAYGESKPLQL